MYRRIKNEGQAKMRTPLKTLKNECMLKSSCGLRIQNSENVINIEIN